MTAATLADCLAAARAGYDGATLRVSLGEPGDRWQFASGPGELLADAFRSTWRPWMAPYTELRLDHQEPEAGAYGHVQRLAWDACGRTQVFVRVRPEHLAKIHGALATGRMGLSPAIIARQHRTTRLMRLGPDAELLELSLVREPALPNIKCELYLSPLAKRFTAELSATGGRLTMDRVPGSAPPRTRADRLAEVARIRRELAALSR